MPLATAVDSWTRCCEQLAGLRDIGVEPHLESFGGCLMGQLCPPSLLVALSVLEGMFFRQHGLRSISLSYAQQTHPDQDREAVLALRRLAADLLSDVDIHVVVYAYMGVYPKTAGGATLLLAEAARLAVRTGAARLIVKTTAEAHRIPTVAENVAALEAAAAAARDCRSDVDELADTGIYAEARALVDAVLDLGPDLGRALADAFRLGYLDVPFCLHPDNAGRARGRLDRDGRLRWSSTGAMPLRPDPGVDDAAPTSSALLTALSYVEHKFDDAAMEAAALI
jgi:methylaspartate mutase epsilon subunit